MKLMNNKEIYDYIEKTIITQKLFYHLFCAYSLSDAGKDATIKSPDTLNFKKSFSDFADMVADFIVSDSDYENDSEFQSDFNENEQQLFIESRIVTLISEWISKQSDRFCDTAILEIAA